MIIAIGIIITIETRIYTYFESKKINRQTLKIEIALFCQSIFFNIIFFFSFKRALCTSQFSANEHSFDETQFKQMPKQGDEIVTLLI